MFRANAKTAIPPLRPELRMLQRSLRTHIAVLAGDIGDRHVGDPESLERSNKYIATELSAMGYDVMRHAFACDGQSVENISVTVPGELDENLHVVFGAHYDTIPGSPGANDNATGVAAVIELARAARNSRPDRTLHFAFFVNEEAPYFHTDVMGSWQYAHEMHRANDNVVAMLSIESIGYFTDEPHSQHYPPALQPLYPSVGNFIGFVSNVESTSLLRRVVEVYRKNSPVPPEAAAVPDEIPGVSWSDQWGFWEHGFPALMVTDTAPFRYPHYHTAQDTPDQLDYERFTYVVSGLGAVLRDLSIEP